jgi:hypothetical protein
MKNRDETKMKASLSNAQFELLVKKEVAEALRVKERTVEVWTAMWGSKVAQSEPGQLLPSSPANGLRPTRVGRKLVRYNRVDVDEFILNARREQEGLPAVRMEVQL